jgi:TRAP-type C4-dicarboxylate transport system permease small subunit
MYETFIKITDWIARGMAFVGGTVLIALIAMTCLSIAGRALVPFGFAPIKGDFELIEIGVGFAIFAFLPWCQLQRGHAAVDLFKPVFSAVLNRSIDLLVDMGMFAAASILAWRLWLGMLDKHSYGETTFILQFPIWTAYAAGCLGAISFVIVAAFCIFRSVRGLLGISEAENAHVKS